MIQDFDSAQISDTLDADLCIIGSGAAGITIAKEFLDSGLKVIVLAGGSRTQTREDQALYNSRIVGLPHPGTHEGRARTFGGTTTLWGGQALPLDTIDFEPRPWVAHSGWPFARTEIDPYYGRAQAVMHLPPSEFDRDVWRLFGITPPAYNPDCLSATFSQWSPKPNFATAYWEALAASKSVTVYLNAHAATIQANPAASSVSHVEVRALSGKTARLRARGYILCGGGIETARLLLASNSVEPQGLGNRHDVVGRYFQDHPAVKFAEVHPSRRGRFQELYDHFYVDGLKQLPKIALAETAQRQNEVLNAVAIIMFDMPPDSGITASKEVLRALKSKQLPPAALLWNAAKNAGEVVKLTYRYRVQKRSFSPKRGPIYLEAHCEQEPNPDSRISLTDEVDALGMRRAQIDWRVTDLHIKTVRVLAETIAAEFERLQIGHLEPLEVLSPSCDWRSHIYDVNHHIGTTRMHDDPQWGVVDRNCQVHGLDNLYIGSSSVFPTGGYSNPTLTMMALCLRLSDRLKTLL
ncbi:MAG: GMC family oxidoreductase [Armatimonadota bacterium]|nr:GMC family oxidoreductase [Armatimonadota bacterium]